MPPQKSKRRSRKRKASTGKPRAVPSPRREQRAERAAESSVAERRAARTLGVEGERPASPFGGLPVSELAILLGIVCAVMGLLSANHVAVAVGVGVCALGVIEVTAREHFAGYRSHASLLAGIAAVAAGALVVALLGRSTQRAFVLLAVIPVYGLVFWALRRRFQIARRARVARPSARRS